MGHLAGAGEHSANHPARIFGATAAARPWACSPHLRSAQECIVIRSILTYIEIIQARYKRPFSQFVKKAHKPLQLAIEDAVEAVCADPSIGEAKVADLAGIWVYKFRFNRQEYLVAYSPPLPTQRERATAVEFLVIDFYQVGTHENFYDTLKRYLREE